jgi:hypothetical protein
MWPYLFVIVGIALGIYGVGLVQDARRCATWPTVEGQILRTDAQVVSREKDQRRYAPNVVYTYAVNGKSHESSRLTLVPRNYAQLSTVQDILAQYPAGGTTRVFHHPDNPANCVLVTTPTGTEWAYPVAGLVFLVLGLFMFRQD